MYWRTLYLYVDGAICHSHSWMIIFQFCFLLLITLPFSKYLTSSCLCKSFYYPIRMRQGFWDEGRSYFLLDRNHFFNKKKNLEWMQESDQNLDHFWKVVCSDVMIYVTSAKRSWSIKYFVLAEVKTLSESSIGNWKFDLPCTYA